MARLKRKAETIVDAAAPPAKKGGRTPNTRKSKRNVESTASSSRPNRSSLGAAAAPVAEPSSTNGASKKPAKKISKAQTKSASTNTSKAAIATPEIKSRRKGGEAVKTASNDEAEEKDTDTSARRQSAVSIKVSTTKKKRDEDDEHEADVNADGPSYWLMKAEPESRIEKGKDVKFSIDDLKAATTPEGWDGVRNAVARNNMRTMMKGDMAFFYHSNCKVPGIVGTMEIVQEHSVDEAAFDPEHPYYDEKSDREKPKWCLVHVEFRQKFPEMIKLKDLQKFSKDGGVLENMQTLRQSRLSVSKVSKKEWDFIMSLVDVEDAGAASPQK